jgi:glycosyltransferase involved in cell wall biosynthesis
MKKILIISQGFEPEFFPINFFAKNLGSQFKVDILTGQPNYPSGKIYPGYSAIKFKKENAKHYNIYRVPVFPRGSNSNIKLIFNYLSFIISSSLFGLYLLRGNKYDYILVYATSPIFQSLSAVFLNYFKKAKLILWVQDLWPEVLKDIGLVRNKILLSSLDKLINKIYYSFDLIFTQSESFKRLIEKKIKKQVSIKILHNPGYNYFGYGKTKSNKNIKILYAGNIGKAQPVEFLKKLIEALPKNYFFYIAGSGKDFSKLYKINNLKNKNFKILGNLKFNQLKHYYNSSDALFLFLKNNSNLNKTIPSKLQSYLSVGKPIIASISGESRNIIVSNQLGYVSKPCNINDTLRVLKKFSSITKTKKNKLGQSCRKFYIKNYSIKKIINLFIKEVKNI